MNEAQKLVQAAIAACRPATGYQLHKVMDVSEATVSQWRSGKKHPSGKHILQLIEIAKRQPLPAQQQQAKPLKEGCILCEIAAALKSALVSTLWPILTPAATT